MKYNTKSITNILDEVFIGRYSGVDVLFEEGETRFLPSFVSNHIAGQMIVKIKDVAKERKEDLPNENDLLPKILGEEIATAEETEKLSLKEEIDRHELEFKGWQENKKKEEMIKNEKAEEILKEDSTAGGIPQVEDSKIAKDEND